MPVVFSRRVTERTIVNVLYGGFGLVLLLLLAAGSVALRNGREIQYHAESLLREQALAARLMEEIRDEQAVLNSVVLQLANEPQSRNTEQLLRRLSEADATLSQIAREAGSRPRAPLWRSLSESAEAFSAEARRLIGRTDINNESLRPLIHHHQRVVELTDKLSEASSQRALSADTAIAANAGDLMQESVLLLGACMILALGGSLLTIRTVAQLFGDAQEHSNELNRVSWQMLKGQEETVRRFSHELHDELGQGLTALRSNLEAIDENGLAARRADAIAVVDECIDNVREMSQLLRPVILDDFGLAAGLQWLAENFSRRTGLPVGCRIIFEGRLEEDIETHLFRVAQEALTNVARHSGATRAEIHLTRDKDRTTLSIIDDGRGLLPAPKDKAPSLGILGMRARARHVGGDLTIVNRKEGGLEVSIWVPSVRYAEQETPHPVG
ncbi:MAG: sensor histidine kinase [Acidobacteria bacterium]|nr:sensor histidine kinase [Acidobacteriota bacterium]